MSVLKAAQLISSAGLSSGVEPSNTWITVHAAKVEAIIGIWPHERQTPQPLIIDLAMQLSQDDWLLAATQGELDRSIDYSKIARVISAIAEQGRFRLIESLAYLIAYALFVSTSGSSRGEIERIRLKILKPHALRELELGEAAPSVSCELSRGEFRRAAEEHTRSLTAQHDLSELSVGVSRTSGLSADVALRLPEVTVLHITSAETGALICAPHERWVMLSGDTTDDASTLSWSAHLSALMFIDHEAQR